MSENDDIFDALTALLFKIAKIVIAGILIALFTHWITS